MKTAAHPLAATALALTLAQWNEIVGIAAGLAAFAYTIWRWRRDARHGRK